MNPTFDVQWPGRRAWLRIAVGATVAVAFLLAASVGLVAGTAERCASCHVDGPEALEVREGHATIECGTCHPGPGVVDRVGFATTQVFGMYLRLPVTSGRATAHVDDSVCGGCHDLTGGPSQVSALRIDHATCTDDLACTDCHSRVAHGDDVEWHREYDMFQCVSCHMTRGLSVECDLCHTERSREERVRTGTFSLTHGSNWRQAHGMGDSLACASCHTADKCVKCHGAGVPHESSFSTTHSRVAVQSEAQCTSCHQPTFCSDCHGLEMPHPKTFAEDHSSVVESDGQAACDNCHSEADCTTCHILHIHPGGAKDLGGD